MTVPQARCGISRTGVAPWNRDSGYASRAQVTLLQKRSRAPSFEEALPKS